MALSRGIGARRDATRGTSPIEARKALAGLFSATGVLPGAPSPLLTGNAAWTYTVAGPAWFVASRGPSDGVMLYENDGDTVIGTTGVGSTVPTAPGAGLSRIDIAWTRHQTAGENGDPATTVALASEPLFGVASGVAAVSNPVAPTLPAGAIELGRNLMTSAATSCASAGNTISQSAPVAMLRGTTVIFTDTVTGATIGANSTTGISSGVTIPAAPYARVITGGFGVTPATGTGAQLAAWRDGAPIRQVDGLGTGSGKAGTYRFLLAAGVSTVLGLVVVAQAAAMNVGGDLRYCYHEITATPAA